MDPARSRLYSATNELLDFLGLLDAVETLAAARAVHADSVTPEALEPGVESVQAFADPARLHRLGYLVVIVLGYAAFERFVRDLIGFVARTTSTFCPTYGDLPKPIRDHHLRLTLKVTSLATERSTFDDVSVTTMLTKLLACVGGTSPYSLNDEVFSDHSANFRMSVLREAFRRVGVEVAEEPISPILSDLLKGALSGVYGHPSSVIDDLSDRRNHAAHGDEIELLDRPTLRAMMDFVRGLADLLAEDAYQCLAKELILRAGAEIGKVEHTWVHPQTGERTICRVRPAVEIQQEQRIILAGSTYRPARIRSIQLDGVEVSKAGPTEAPHGVDVGVVAHDGQRLFAASAESLELLEGLVTHV